MNDKTLILYARLILYRGLNLREGEDLVINAPITAQDFVRALTQEAYKTFKSGTVHVNWQDPVLSRLAYAYAKEDVLEDVPEYIVDRLKDTVGRKAAFLTVSSSFPGLMNGLDQKRIQKANRAMGKKLKPHQEQIARTCKWSVAAYPSIQWAKKVYPDLDDSDALLQLHEDLITIMRLDEEKPIDSWTNHLNTLEQKRRKLNEYRFRRLEYSSDETDLTVELPEKHLWVSGAQKRGDDIFIPNMPTEEVFTAPLKTGVNGKLKVTRPLNVRGTLLQPFTLHFKYGEVVKIDSPEKDKIEKIIALDKGARFLGEVALVPKESPINQLDKVYYNTLLDENATCHFALGNAYPMSVKDKGQSASEIAERNNINRSLIHIDFMVGSNDLTITGITEDGQRIPIFEDGTWSENFS